MKVDQQPIRLISWVLSDGRASAEQDIATGENARRGRTRSGARHASVFRVVEMKIKDYDFRTFDLWGVMIVRFLHQQRCKPTLKVSTLLRL
jgi:hypothetical protein